MEHIFGSRSFSFLLFYHIFCPLCQSCLNQKCFDHLIIRSYQLERCFDVIKRLTLVFRVKISRPETFLTNKVLWVCVCTAPFLSRFWLCLISSCSRVPYWVIEITKNHNMISITHDKSLWHKVYFSLTQMAQTQSLRRDDLLFWPTGGVLCGFKIYKVISFGVAKDDWYLYM